MVVRNNEVSCVSLLEVQSIIVTQRSSSNNIDETAFD